MGWAQVSCCVGGRFSCIGPWRVPALLGLPLMLLLSLNPYITLNRLIVQAVFLFLLTCAMPVVLRTVSVFAGLHLICRSTISAAIIRFVRMISGTLISQYSLRRPEVFVYTAISKYSQICELALFLGLSVSEPLKLSVTQKLAAFWDRVASLRLNVFQLYHLRFSIWSKLISGTLISQYSLRPWG